MNYSELFDALDLERPDLHEVKTAVVAGDPDAATRALASHLRQRATPQWFFSWRDRPEPTGAGGAYPEAEKILRREITYGFHGAPEFTTTFGERIDWGANPTKGEYGTHLWNECLNRHFHFEALTKAYWATGDDRFARGLVRDWLDWIEHNPRPLDSSGNGVARPYGCYAWQTLTTGVRMENTWPNALYRCLDSPAFTDEAIAAIFWSARDQAKHLMQWPTRNNWLTEESMGLYTTGMLFPEFRAAAQWRRTAIDRLYGQLADEVYPDGAEYELSSSYGHWVIRNFVNLLERARLNGLESELPDDLEAKMEKMFDYALRMAMPDSTMPVLNDSSSVDVAHLLKTGHRMFPHRQDFLYLATAREKGTPPVRVSCGLPYSGHYVMRSGWGTQDLYMLMDSGPFGSAHQHEDKLHFVLYAYGRPHVLDPGNYSYDSSRWREYVLTTPGHNTVMVDGLGQKRRDRQETYVWLKPWTTPAPPGNDTVWRSSTGFDYVRGTYEDGYGPENDDTVTHTRSVLFMKPAYWVIADTLSPSDDNPHEYESLFHLDTPDAQVEDGTLAVRTGNTGAANLAIIPLVDEALNVRVVSGQESPVQGWANNPWRAVPTAIYSKTASHTTRFVYVLYPTQPGDAVPIVSVTPLSPEDEGDGAAVEITFDDGRVDVLLFSGQPGQPVTFGVFSTDGEAAAVRLQKDGAVDRSFLVNGTFIRRDGEPIAFET